MSDDVYRQMVLGSAAKMRVVQDGEADLVLTSPPYFSEETGILLREKLEDQTKLGLVQQGVTHFALTLRPAFTEIVRILKPGGACVLQTKDIRYGGFLIPLSDVHRSIAEGEGLLLATRVIWNDPFHRPSQRGSRETHRMVGGFRCRDAEEFLVFALAPGLRVRDPIVDLTAEEIKACASPVWELPGPGRSKTHPYQSPASVIRRFVALYSEPGDLVVDPFAGHGTTLRVASEMGRRSIGYDIDRSCIDEADKLLRREL